MEKYAGRGVRPLVSPGPVLSAATADESKNQPPVALEIGSKPQPHPKAYPARWDVMILLLAVVGGSVDGVMLSAFNALAGAQTGNTVLLGISLAHGQLPLAAAQTAAFLGYLVGAAIGQSLIVNPTSAFGGVRARKIGHFSPKVATTFLHLYIRGQVVKALWQLKAEAVKQRGLSRLGAHHATDTQFAARLVGQG
jgi:Protein of unknown function (DUF1275)